MNVIFMGTPDFAVPVLQALLDADEHRVTAVITQPDKARGRSFYPGQGGGCRTRCSSLYA